MANLFFLRRGGIRRIFSVVVFLNIAISYSAYAAEFEPSINLAGYYTNNLFLLPDELRESDWVTQLRPGIVINHESSRIIFNFDYALQALFYANNDQFDEVFNQLDSSAWVDLVGDELVLFASANVTQVNVRPGEPLANTNIPVTGNRSDANILTVGPRWTRRLFLGSEIDAYVYTGKASFDAADTQDVVPVRVGVTLQPYDSAHRTRYRVAYNYVSLDYDISGDIKNQELSVELARDVSESTALTALVGLESDLEDLSDDSLSEWRWEAGFNTGAGDNTLSASFGHRYFGDNFRVAWARSSAKRRFTLTYREFPSNSDFLDIQRIPTEPADPDALPPPPDPDSGLNRRGAAGRFINKRFDTSLSFYGYKNTMTLTAFFDDRVSLIEDTPDVDSFGVIFDFNRSLGVRTDFSSVFSWTRREAFIIDPDTGLESGLGEDDTYNFSATVSHLFGRATTVTLEGRYDMQDDDGNIVRNYDAVLLMLGWTRSFGKDAN